MARDYKKNHKSKRTRPALFGNLLSFISGLSIGLLVAFFILLRSQLPEPAAPSADEESNEPVAEEGQQKLTFDFYEVLSNRKLNISEWVAKDERADAGAQTEQEQTPAQPEQAEQGQQGEQEAQPEPAEQEAQGEQEEKPESDVYGYVLQVGSFKDFTAADQVKAELALMGIFADIQRVMLNGQSTVHRVRLGPYKTPAEMEETRARLEANQVEFILLELRLSGDSA